MTDVVRYDVSSDNPFPDWLVPGVILTYQEKNIEIKNAIVIFEKNNRDQEFVYLYRVFGDQTIPQSYMVNKTLDWYLNHFKDRALLSHWLSDDLNPAYEAYSLISVSFHSIYLKDNITIIDNLSPETYPYGRGFQPILKTIRRLEKRQEYYKTFIKGKPT